MMDASEATNLMKEVIAILEEANVPSDLRVTAFEHVWMAISPATPAAGQVVGQAAPARSGVPAPTNGKSTDLIAGLSQRLKVEAAVVAEVYHIDDQGIATVAVASPTLPAGKKRAQEELALLVAAASHVSGETTVPVEAVREACRRYNKFDQANFASNMKGGEKWWMLQGSGKKATLKLRQTGWEEAAVLTRKYGGAS